MRLNGANYPRVLSHFTLLQFLCVKIDVDPSIPTPNAVTQIGVIRKVLASSESDGLKSYDLVWLLHLIGDVRQPLHAASVSRDLKKTVTRAVTK